MVLDPTKFILPFGAPGGGQQAMISSPLGPADVSTVGTPITSVLVLSADDLTNQIPVSENVPIQITYGPAQGTGADPVHLLADGTISVNTPGTYAASFDYMFGRTTGSQSAVVGYRALIGGIQVGETVNIAMGSDDQSVPYGFTSFDSVPGGTLITTELARDTAGPNDGGLILFPTSVPGWGPASSASVRIWQLLNG